MHTNTWLSAAAAWPRCRHCHSHIDVDLGGIDMGMGGTVHEDTPIDDALAATMQASTQIAKECACTVRLHVHTYVKGASVRYAFKHTIIVDCPRVRK